MAPMAAASPCPVKNFDEDTQSARRLRGRDAEVTAKERHRQEKIPHVVGVEIAGVDNVVEDVPGDLVLEPRALLG